MAKQFTVTDFFRRFPDDDACLEHLFKVRLGSEFACERCGVVGKWGRLKKLPAYTCDCGNHVHPMVGTPFEKSRTPLQKWFYAMYLFTTSRHGVPAKELQRQLGVTYKTAWRIGHEIRKYMGEVDGDDALSGHVEIDETYVGGRHKGRNAPRSAGKTVVFGAIERDGNLYTTPVPDVKKATLLPIITGKVEQGSTISTDELRAYASLSEHGYTHGSVAHSLGEYAKGKHHVNTLEGFWARLKLSIKGTHVHVSGKHLPKYLGEFEYRFNMRHHPEAMFSRLLLSF